MKAYRILILLLILVLFPVYASAQGTVKFVNDGAGEYAKKLVDFHAENHNNLLKKNQTEPFAVGFFGWKSLTIVKLPFNQFEGANLKICRLALSFYDNELDAPLEILENRPKSLTTVVEATESEQQTVQKFVVQKHGGKYLGFTALFSGNIDEEPDEIAKWKYSLGANLGELAGYVTKWYAFPNNARYDETIAEDLRRLDEHIKEAPPRASAELIGNLKNLRSFGSKNKFTLVEREQIAASLKQTLFSTISLADLPNSKSASSSQAAKPVQTAPILPKKDAAGFIESGKAFAAKGEHQKAIIEYNEAIKLNASNGLAFYHRAKSLEAVGNIDAAIRDYDRMISLKTNLVTAFYNRGTLYLEKEDYLSAISDFDRSIAIDATRANSYYNRGLAHYNLKNLDRAQDDFSQAIALSPKDADAYLMRATVYCRKKLIMSAIKDQQQAIRLGEKIQLGCQK